MSNFMRKLFRWVIFLILIVGPFILWSQRDNLYDSWRLRSYAPPAQVEALADRTTMTDKARRLFYVYHPKIEGKESFAQNCSDSEQTIVLGCYISRQGIYLYDVTDDRLEGVEEVTAAHEVLHAAYQRLSGKERTRVDSLLQAAYKQNTNERITSTINQYAQKDPGVVNNELHSILASEQRTLPDELEQYYAQYFTRRMAVVEFSEQYETEFTRRQVAVASYDAQIASLKEQIDSRQSELNNQKQQIEEQQDEMDNLRASSPELYNQQVPIYNARITSYNRNAAALSALIEKHNALVVERNSIAEQISQLAKSIDSRPGSL